ncbi:NTP transferase domain-containing protein [Acidomonas methanolica]|uniref:NTP transferase domain-containing protein n=1 Tax=Acidomonas methanolica TaxID=437 RepID=UPI00211A69D7
MTTPLYGLILAGGQSTRMGQDKAALDYAGQPQLDAAFALLAPLVERCFVSVRPDQIHDPVRARFPQIVDRLDSVGPAAGLLAAHAAHPHVAWLAVACDLPRLDRATLDTLIAARDTACHSAVAFRSTFDDLPEPLCTIWEPAALTALAASFAQGRTCPRKTLIHGDTRLLPPRSGGALDNVNTPQERDAALARIGAP